MNFYAVNSAPINTYRTELADLGHAILTGTFRFSGGTVMLEVSIGGELVTGRIRLKGTVPAVGGFLSDLEVGRANWIGNAPSIDLFLAVSAEGLNQINGSVVSLTAFPDWTPVPEVSGTWVNIAQVSGTWTPIVNEP